MWWRKTRDIFNNHYYASIKNPACNEYKITWENYHDIKCKKKNWGNALIFDDVKVRGLFREERVKERMF